MNDFLLILQMKQGNEKAFDKFVRKYYAGILSYCRYHCMNQAEAEDLTQETFLRFMENIASYQHIGKAKNYLYVIAGNLCKNYAKKWKAESVEQEILERELVSDGGIHRKEKRMDVLVAKTAEGPALGAAMFAAMAAGIYTNIQETYDHMGIHDFTVYKPDEIHRAAYEELYRKNKHLRNMLRGVSAEGLNLEVNS